MERVQERDIYQSLPTQLLQLQMTTHCLQHQNKKGEIWGAAEAEDIICGGLDQSQLQKHELPGVSQANKLLGRGVSPDSNLLSI